MKEKVLVTGANGFVGSHLVEYLLRKKYYVKAFCEYNSFGSAGWLEDSRTKDSPNLEIVFGDIRDFGLVNAEVKNCRYVIHLAALIAIPYSYQASESYLQTNVNGTLNLLRASVDNKVERFIHTSTSEVYGTPTSVPIFESHSLNAQSPYAASKIAADQMVLAFNKSFGLPSTILRPFNIFGPRQSTRAIIPTLISQALSENPYIKVGSISPRREFNYVNETIRAFELALSAKGINGEIMNIGNGFQISIENLARLISEILGIELRIQVDPNRIRPVESEVMELQSDSSKAKKYLNWFTSLEGEAGLRHGLVDTIEWFKNPSNLIHYKHTNYGI